MTPSFAVRTTAHYNRLSNKLHKAHPDFDAGEKRAATILATDPYNRTRRYHIKKPEGIPPGQGQYRLSLGRLRFRNDIAAQLVELHYCGLRREDTY